MSNSWCSILAGIVERLVPAGRDRCANRSRASLTVDALVFNGLRRSCQRRLLDDPRVQHDAGRECEFHSLDQNASVCRRSSGWLASRLHAVAGIGAPDRFLRASARRLGHRICRTWHFPTITGMSEDDLDFRRRCNPDHRKGCRKIGNAQIVLAGLGAARHSAASAPILVNSYWRSSMDVRLLEILVCPVCKGPSGESPMPLRNWCARAASWLIPSRTTFR
jgi:hypothetical protein